MLSPAPQKSAGESTLNSSAEQPGRGEEKPDLVPPPSHGNMPYIQIAVLHHCVHSPQGL